MARVASYVDAWIERRRSNAHGRIASLVASYVDAWIERLSSTVIALLSGVASYVDAWIESRISRNPDDYKTSRILCGCVD